MNIYNSPDVETISKNVVNLILPLINAHDVCVGVSAPFTMLTDLSHACIQAALGIQYGEKNYRYLPRREDQLKGVYEYKDIIVYHMLQSSRSGAFDFSVATRIYAS